MNKLKFIKTFEAYQVDGEQQPEVTSDKNDFNNLEKNVKEFNSKKGTLQNIYNTFKDETDLINKLRSQKFIDGNNKGIQFTNPILGLLAQSYSKKRELVDLENKIKAYQEQLNAKQSELNTSNDTTKELVNSEIKNIQNTLTDARKTLADMNADIVTLEKQSQDKLKQMQDQLKIQKDRIEGIDKYRK